MANWKGTTVPNSGILTGGLYVNTELSNIEIESMIDVVAQDLGGQFMYPVLNCSNDEGFGISLLLTRVDSSYSIIFQYGENQIDVYSSDEGGFNMGNIELSGYINNNSLSSLNLTYSNEFMGIPTGTENDKLSSLFSITPFTQSEDKNILMHPKNEDGTLNKNINYYPITKVGNLLASNGSKFTMPNVAYKQGGGTPVPNTGNVNGFYFNINLNTDKIRKLFSNVEILTMNGLYGYCLAFYNKYLDGESFGVDGIFLVSQTSTLEQFTIQTEPGTIIFDSTSGWSEDILQLNGVVGGTDAIVFELMSEAMGMPVGTENDKLSSLFAITPFEEGGLFETNEDGTPNTDKPIQTGISEERVNELIDLKITGWLGGES